ncbi:hypothetical protein [Prochlorococcus marinus]|uniref:hypothetical protein n=1 Tax=Prochlorococcus marinus TaxID=1219 RepID=UPI001F4C8412|nr:hypothetical protein [Prochlorococcus marinus]
MNPAKYATVTGKSDNEHGPRLVRRPPVKIIIKVNGPGDCKPWLINCSLLRAKSDIAKSRKEIEKSGLSI